MIFDTAELHVLLSALEAQIVKLEEARRTQTDRVNELANKVSSGGHELVKLVVSNVMTQLPVLIAPVVTNAVGLAVVGAM